MVLSIEERIFLVEHFARSNSYVTVRKEFVQEYNRNAPSKSSTQKIIKKWRSTGSILDQKKRRTKTALTLNKLTEISNRLQNSPTKSLRRLSAQSGVSLYSAHQATKQLGLKAYKVSVQHQLLPADFDRRTTFCNWIRDEIFIGQIDPNLLFFSDEAWFHLSGYINSQNNRYWSTDNPHQVHEIPLHDQKIGVWCAISRTKIIGPIFFQDTVNSERYIANILRPFFDQLTDYEKQNGTFQQDNATAHTAHASMAAIREVFEDRIISRNRWPARSPDLNPCDFFLWGFLKAKVYENNPHTLDELRTNITNLIQAIPEQMLSNVYDNFIKRTECCIEENGHQFQHFL